MPKKENIHQARKQKVFGYLNKKGGVATREEIQEEMGIPLWAINQMINDCLYSSLNHNGKYVASKYTVGHRCDRKGFWITRKDGKDIVFHRCGDSRNTLKYLAHRTPWGITPREAEEMLGRPCYRMLNKLYEERYINRVKLGGVWIYLHPWEKKQRLQIKERITNHRVRPEKLENDKDEHVFLEEILEDFQEFTKDKINSIPPSRIAILLLMYLKNDGYRDVEARLKVSERLRTALGIDYDEVPDYSTICRDFNRLDSQEQMQIIKELVRELMNKGVIEGDYLVVDGTHFLAWINTRKKVEDGEIENASWGEHGGKFYGYKLLLLIDAKAELPVEIVVVTGKKHDSAMYIPLISTFAKDYDVDVKGVFSDGAFDDQKLKEATRKILGCELFSAINPRRSKIKKHVKEWVKKVFKKHGHKIKDVRDALKFIPQTLLTSFGVKLGTKEESYIIHAIKERMNRHLRAAVERVISRLKRHLPLERPRVEPFEKIRKHVFFCILSMLSLAFTAKKRGKTSCIRSLSKVI
jgi:transposase